MFEEERLFPPNDPRLKEIQRQKQRGIDYLKYHDAVAQVLNNPVGYQKSETHDPPSAWLNDVHFRMTQLLGLKDWSCLKVYSALGTALDQYHGVDLLVRYTEPETGRMVDITVDFTLNTKKDSYKADVIVNDLGAIPNARYPFVAAQQIEDMEYGNAEDDRYIESQRRDGIARAVVDILREKLFAKVPAQHKRIEYGRGLVRNAVRDALYA